MRPGLISVSVLIMLLVFYTAARRAKPIPTTDGGYLLQYAAVIKGFVAILILIVIGGMGFALLNIPIRRDSDIYAMGMMSAMALLGVIYLSIEYFTVRVWVGPNGIIGTSGWRGKREYRWDEIKRITYSPSSMLFLINSPGKPSLRVSAMLSGMDTFSQFCAKYLPAEVWAEAQRSYGKT